MSSFEMYILLMLDAWGILLTLPGVLLTVVACISLGISLVGYEYNERNIKWGKLIAKKCLLIGLPLIILGVSLPTTKQAAAIIVVPKLINNERLQNIGDNGIKILEDLTVNWAKELSVEK